MSTLLIEGGHRLGGRVAVEGNKNAALPLLAASLLTEDECVLTNVPRIGDVEVMARLLLDLGVEVDGIGTTTLRIRAKRVNSHAPDRALVGRLRGSTSFAANGLISSSPPVFSLMEPAQVLNVLRPTPAGHDVWIFQTVVSAALALRMNGAATTAAPPAATAAVFNRRRRAGSASGVDAAGTGVFSSMESPP